MSDTTKPATYWLISYECREVFKTKLGMSVSTKFCNIELLTNHPALMLADEARYLQKLTAEEYNSQNATRKALEIIRVFSINEVPADILTIDDMLAFKRGSAVDA